MLTRIMPIHGPGGMQNYVLSLSRKLAEFGHEVIIITTSHPDNPHVNFIECKDNITVYYLGGCQLGEYSHEYWSKSLITICKIHKKNSLDIIHAHNAAGLYIYRSRINKALRIPFVITWHGTHLDWIISSFFSDLLTGAFKCFMRNFLIHIKRYILFEFWMTRYADAVIAIDKHHWKMLKIQFLLSDEKLKLINLGIDTKLFAPTKMNLRIVQQLAVNKLNLEKRHPIILIVSRLEKAKGVQLAIKAMRYIKELYPNALMLIAGTGSYINNLKTLVDRLNLSDYVYFMGYVHHDLIPYLINLCDIFLNLSTERVGINTTILEAMSCGKVVIGYKGGAQLVIRNGYNGLLLEKPSENLLARLINIVISDKKPRETIGYNARKTILKNYNLEKMTKQIVGLYETLRNKYLVA